MRFVLVAIAVLVVSACSTGFAGGDAYNEGVQHQQRGESALAEQQFKIAIQQNAAFAEAHLNLGVLYLQDGWLEGAEQETRQSIKLLEASKRTLVAGSTYEQTLSLAYTNLATVEVRQAASELQAAHITVATAVASQARDDLETAVKLDPANGKAQALRVQLQ